MKMKQQAIVWEEVFTNYISDKGLISEYIKYSSLTQKQMFQFFFVFFFKGMNLNRHFTPENTQTANKHIISH